MNRTKICAPTVLEAECSLLLKIITGVALEPLPNECESLLSDGSDLVAEEMKFGCRWNSTSTTITLVGPPTLYQGSGPPGCTTPRQPTIYKLYTTFFNLP